MIPEYRQAFNEAFTAQKYSDFLVRLEKGADGKPEFRVAESPFFLPRDLMDLLVTTADQLIERLSTPEELEASRAAVPAELDHPGCDLLPTFVQVDFGLVRSAEGRIEPRLIELQGFPSLYAFQLLQAEEALPMVPGHEGLLYLLGGLDHDGYLALVGHAILNDHPPENVVLMDVRPTEQKTHADFRVSRRYWGVRSVCPTSVEKRGRELWYDLDGKPTRILRIYNRMIADEILASGTRLPFDWRDELDVEWAPHPNWFYRWSKYSLPRLDHPMVPRSLLLSEFESWPDDLERWVLKPLFSFAGGGVKLDLTRQMLDAIPPERRASFLLMQKIDYEPLLESVDGSRSKCEVRIMYAQDQGRPRPVNTLVRLSQGKMMGVDFNRDRTWVGSSPCFWPR